VQSTSRKEIVMKEEPNGNGKEERGTEGTVDLNHNKGGKGMTGMKGKTEFLKEEFTDGMGH